MKSTIPTVLRWSDRLYDSLLKAYPVEFRSDYALEMRQVFADLCLDSYRVGGVSAVLRLWPTTLADLILSIAREYLTLLSLKKGESRMSEMALSLILPAHNEIEHIEVVVAEALEALPRVAASFEVLIINDGSNDGTREIVERLAAAHPEQVRVIHFADKVGYKAALSAGIKAAQGIRLMIPNPHQPYRAGLVSELG